MSYRSDEQQYMLMVDYERVPLKYLIKRLAEVEATPEDEACDNLSDRLCCDHCGASELAAEIRRRKEVHGSD